MICNHVLEWSRLCGNGFLFRAQLINYVAKGEPPCFSVLRYTNGHCEYLLVTHQSSQVLHAEMWVYFLRVVSWKEFIAGKEI